MTRAEIRSLIRNSLPKVDKNNRFHDLYIDGCAEKSLASLYHDIFLIKPLALANYTKGYGYATPIAIQTENSTGIQYCTLPESIIPFEDKFSGVRRISTPTQGPFMFFPMEVTEKEYICHHRISHQEKVQLFFI